MSRKALEGLRDKYAEILALRRADDTGESDDAQTRARMATLSSQFPGALREIDDLELSEIESRIAAVEAVLRGDGEVEQWMEAIALFHALARGALCAKRWLAKRRHVDAEVERAYIAAASGLEFPEEARSWATQLARVASPPRGRILDVIFARIAKDLDIGEREARTLVFGVPRRERKRR